MFWQNVAYAGNRFMPVQGSDLAVQVDRLYAFLLIASFVSCVLVIGGLIYFAIKYRRKSNQDKTAYISHNNTLEFLWSFIPFVIFMLVFGWGWKLFHDMRNAPSDSMEVNVVAQKWSWDFTYKNGRRSTNEFYVPVNTPVKLIMTSNDVLHSFFIPSMRVKQDVVPGRYTSLWFHPNQEGEYQVFCTEYCGTGHSAMLAKVHVLTREKYEEWLQNDPYKGLSLAEMGQKIFNSKCTACHNASSEKKVGPGLLGVVGSQRSFIDGTSAIADENYIRESVLNPNAKVVAGFVPAMPTFAGQLSEQELMGIVEYLKSLK
ncbi:MAG: cytochrome c oxidase subunit II [Bdellovibrionales bacterium]|nr:cytochrome c oxidase subunit II [Bdellovibrionales bacterium]